MDRCPCDGPSCGVPCGIATYAEALDVIINCPGICRTRTPPPPLFYIPIVYPPCPCAPLPPPPEELWCPPPPDADEEEEQDGCCVPPPCKPVPPTTERTRSLSHELAPAYSQTTTTTTNRSARVREAMARRQFDNRNEEAGAAHEGFPTVDGGTSPGRPSRRR